MKPTTIFIFLWILIVTRGPASPALINFSTASDTGNTAPLWRSQRSGIYNQLPGIAIVENGAGLAQIRTTATAAVKAAGLPETRAVQLARLRKDNEARLLSAKFAEVFKRRDSFSP